MDYHIVTLEIADLITHFDYYDSLVSGTANLTDDASAEQIKLRDKCAEHIAGFLPNETFYDLEKKLLSLSEIKRPVIAKLQTMKTKDIHDLVEKLTKDVKKIKKLYKSL